MLLRLASSLAILLPQPLKVQILGLCHGIWLCDLILSESQAQVKSELW
jgi:hypothetical protein